jgi:hypothetical protein
MEESLKKPKRKIVVIAASPIYSTVAQRVLTGLTCIPIKKQKL